MKFRQLFALVLTLSLMVWAREARIPQLIQVGQDATAQPEAKGCCHNNLAGMKDGEGCCHHAAADAKEAATCCGKNKCEAKDVKSCCEGKDMKAAMAQCKKNGCCSDGKCCADGKCGGEAKGDKTAMGCCGSKCERHQHTQAGS